MLLSSTTATGNNEAHENRQPFLTVTYAIALQGIFPPSGSGLPDGLFPGDIEPFIGEIIPLAFNFVPRGFAACEGQILQIAQNTALFTLLGTTYGGDGMTTFALPDLRGRTPIGAGDGPGLSHIDLGQVSGTESEVLSLGEMPAHTHSNGAATTGSTGQNQPIDNMMPTLGLNPVIDGNGEILWVPYNFAPIGTAFANGQILPIASFPALFSEIGTIYGGDGVSTFALPDLRGRVGLDDGSGGGLSPRPLGSTTGVETVTLAEANLPAHTHGIPSGGTTGSTGSNVAFENMQPSIALNYQIAMAGVFPSQNLNLDNSNDPAVDADGNPVLQEDLDVTLGGLIDAAIMRWADAGVGAEGIATLRAATYQFGELDPGILASVDGPHVITIDSNAAGRTWFIDATPTDDSEFGQTNPDRELVATSIGALSSIDLLTVLMHEQGHLLGFDHDSTPGSLMSAKFGTGLRRLPVNGSVPAAQGSLVHVDLSVNTPYLGSIHIFAGANIGPGFAATGGQVLSISQNAALFTLIGTTYGGNGTTTFALPDLQGRVAVDQGQGPFLDGYTIGQFGGSETVSLTTNQLPAHTHVLSVPAVGTLQFTTVTKFVAEGDVGQFVTVSLTGTGVLEQDVTVPVSAVNGEATSGADYSLTTVLVTFAAGTDLSTNPTQNVSFTVANDQLVESSTEHFTLNLGTITALGDTITAGAATANNVSITDNDAATVTVSGTASTTEAGATGTLLATLTLQTDGTGPIQLATDITGITLAANADFASDAVSFLTGASSGASTLLTVTAKNDQLVEGPESLSASLADSTSLAGVTEAGSGTVNITDNDAATVTLSGIANTSEAGTTGTLLATLTLQTNGTGPVQLATNITGITLAADADFASDTVSFLTGASSGASTLLTVTAKNDQLVEGPEGLSASLADSTSLAGVTEAGSGTVNITDNDTATVTLSGTATTTEAGATGTLLATLTLQTDGTGPIQLATDITGITLAANADFASDAVSFLTGASSGASTLLTVTAKNDQLVEGPESLSASLADSTSLAGVTEAGSGTVNITDNDAATVTLSGTANTSEAGTTGTLLATLTLQTNGTGPVQLATDITGITLAADADFASNTVSFLSGASSGASTLLTVTAKNDQLVEGPESLSASLADSTSLASVTEAGSGTVNITDNDTATVTLSGTATTTEAGATGTLLATLTLQTDGTGPIQLATDITGITLAANADFASDAVSFLTGASSGASTLLTVTAKNDQLVEGPESLSASLADSTSLAGVTEAGSGTVNITDNDAATVTLSGTANTSEAGTTGTLLATLTLQTNGTGPVQLATNITGITLAADADFASDTVSFLSGASSGASTLLTVTAKNDQLVEGPEGLAASLADTASNATVTEVGTGTVNITDNDTATVTLSGTANTTEAGTTGSLLATLTLQTNGTGPIQLATDVTGVTLAANVDFSSNTVSFSTGALSGDSKSLVVTAVNDNLVEAQESLAANLVNTTSNAAVTEAGTGTVNITDNDTATYTINDATVTEGGNLLFTVSLSNPVDVPTTILVTFTNGTTSANDFDHTTVAVTFAAGSTQAQTIAVPSVSDTVIEGNETFTAHLGLSAPLAGGRMSNTTDTGAGTINNDDSSRLSISAPAITETNGDQVVTFSVTSSNAVEGGFDVAIGSASGTATSNDFALVTKSIHFNGAAGETQLVSVTIKGDTIVESDETFRVILGTVSGTTETQRLSIVTGASATATILDDDVAPLTISAPVINETTSVPRRANFPTENSTVQFTVTSPSAVPGGFDVAILTANGTAGSADYSLVTKKVHFQGVAGETRTITVEIVADAIVENDETFTVTLGAISNTTAAQQAKITTGASATGVIIDDDRQTLIIEAPTITESNSDQIVTFTITSLNAVQDGFDLDLSTLDGTADSSDYSLVTNKVHFTGVANEKQLVQVTIKGDTLLEANETFKVVLGAVSNTSAKQKASISTGASATGTIKNDDRPASANKVARQALRRTRHGG